MRREFAVLAAILVGMVATPVVACAQTGPSLTPAPRSTIVPPSSTPVATATTGPITFRSERYRYALELPAGWYVWGEAPGEWTRFEIGYIGPGTDAFEEDYAGRGTLINFPGITYGLYVSAAEVTPEVTLEAWAEMLAETMHSDSSCQGAPEREALAVGGEPALMLAYDRTDCSHDHHVFVVGLLHGGRGFDIFWLARQGESNARRADFESMLRSFEFED